MKFFKEEKTTSCQIGHHVPASGGCLSPDLWARQYIKLRPARDLTLNVNLKCPLNFFCKFTVKKKLIHFRNIIPKYVDHHHHYDNKLKNNKYLFC